MKYLFTICISLIFSLNALSQAEIIPFRGNSMVVYRVDMSKDQLHFFWKDEEGNLLNSIGKLEQFVAKKNQNLLFATNGGMYLKDSSPQGLYVENGKELKKLNTKNNSFGNFYLKPNGVFLIRNQRAEIETTEKMKYASTQLTYATQSGPMLVIDGKLHSAFNEGSSSKYIRNGVGVIDDQHIVFVISQQPINFYDFALFFQQELKTSNALYLDGAISRMYVRELNLFDKGGNFGCMIGVVK